MAYRFDKPVIAIAMTPEEANVLDDLVSAAICDPAWSFLSTDALVRVKVKLRAEATDLYPPGKRARAALVSP